MSDRARSFDEVAAEYERMRPTYPPEAVGWLTRQDDPVKIERDLQRLVPRADWGRLPHLLIWHGRRVCHARRPLCEECVLNDLCPSSRV